MTEENNHHIEIADGDMVIPKSTRWIFGGILSLIMVAAIPWAIHMDTKLDSMTLAVTKLEVKLESALRVKDKIEGVGQRLRDHVSDPTIHSARLNLLQQQITDLTRRIELLEQQRKSTTRTPQ